MGAPKLAFQPDEILFLEQNFYNLKNEQLRESINEFRASHNQLSCHGFRDRCYRIGFQRGIQIRWNKADIKKLKVWYQIIGDTQISELLNLYGTSSRKINSKIVKRSFTKKHIEKKRNLLGFHRTKKQIENIVKDNKLCSDNQCFTKDNNLWTSGHRKIAKEHDIRIWKCGVNIKINGKFIPYTRWFYKNFIGPVPKDKKVFHIDMDPLNNVPDNLKLIDFGRVSIEDYETALPLIQNKIKNETQNINRKWECALSKDQRKDLMKEINRLQSIKEKIIKKLTIRQKYKSKYYEPTEAF